MASGDLVATWDVPLPDGVHKVEFEHGTTSGKRIIRVDGKVLFILKKYYRGNNLILYVTNFFPLINLHCCK